MSVEYEQRNERVTAVLKDGDQVGVITHQPNGQIGYTIFGTPHKGVAKTEEEAQGEIERFLAD